MTPAEENDESQTTLRPVCILVLGMHRSGTSALTRVLSLLGAALPHDVLGAQENSNETGHWEPTKLVDFHEEILAELGSTWWDWRPFEFSQLSQQRQGEIRAKIADIIKTEYGESPVIVVKEPRICRFVGFFTDALTDAGFQVRSVLIVRNPMEVTQSLAKRDGYLTGNSSLLWLRHVLDAEAATRGSKRAMITYEALLTDWQSAVEKISMELNIEWPRKTVEIKPLVDGFLSSTHRHYEHSTDKLAQVPVLRNWVSRTYDAHLALLQAPSSTTAFRTLDKIRNAFDDAVPILAPLLEETDIELAARALKIIEMQNEVERRGWQIAEHERAIAYRDTQLQHRDTELLEAGKIIDLVTRQRDHALIENELYKNSRSWRITKPLRQLQKVPLEIRKLVNKILRKV